MSKMTSIEPSPNEPDAANTNAAITLVTSGIHNAEEPRHYMRLKDVDGRVDVWVGARRLARSDAVIVCLEVGRDLYDPVYYIPRSDLTETLTTSARQTFCPIKGNASYHHLEGDPDPIAWSYDDPIAPSAALQDRVAFDAKRVTITLTPPADMVA